jgi:hypothetical protein
LNDPKTDLSLHVSEKSMEQQDSPGGFPFIVQGGYDGKKFYSHLMIFLQTLNTQPQKFRIFLLRHPFRLMKTLFLLGGVDSGRRPFWKILFWSLRRKPSAIPYAINFSINGYHFRKAYRRAFSI